MGSWTTRSLRRTRKLSCFHTGRVPMSLIRLGLFMQFEEMTRSAGDDPSIFAIALETLAVKVFGAMGQTARLWLIRDRFIAGHSSWTVYHQKLLSEMLWTDAESGRVTQTERFDGLVSLVRRTDLSGLCNR